MSTPSDNIVNEYQRESDRQAKLSSERRTALGESYYGYKDGTADGMKFQHMMSRTRTWNDPIFTHSLNASFVCGSTYGLYFFFRNPVKSKLFHVFEMLRRTAVGSAVSLMPIGIAAMWRKSIGDKQRANKIKEQNDKVRKVCFICIQFGFCDIPTT